MRRTVTRRNQENYFVIQTARALYGVTIERKTNTTSGAPRWHAVIAVLIENGEPCLTNGSKFNAVYDFLGHYYRALGEARWIVDYYENEPAEVVL